MTTTPNHGLDLITDGDQPWGQRMRDNLTIIDSKLAKVQATLWAVDNATVTDIITQNVPVKASIPGTLGVTVGGEMTFSANRATYTGTNRPLYVVCSFVLDSAGNNKDYRVYLGHNGGVHDYASIKVRHTSSGGFSNGTFTGAVSVVSGDYLELWVANVTDATDVTIVDMSMSIHG